MANDKTSEIKLSIAQILAFITVVSPIFGTAIWTWSNVNRINDRIVHIQADQRQLGADYRSLDATVTVIAAEASANSIHRAEHERSAQFHIERIGENEKCCDQFKSFRARFDRAQGQRQ